MLIGFTFENYLSFFEKTSFSMIANSSDKQYKEINSFSTAQGDLIKSAFIFGANGSGKSNFISAIGAMRNIVLAPIDIQSQMIGSPNYFIFSEVGKQKPVFFEATFLVNDIMFEYGFEILNGKVNKEYLYKKAKRRTIVFTRDNQSFESIELISEMDNVKHLKQNCRTDTLFLYWANFGNNETAMKIYEWFKNIQIFDADNASQLLNQTVSYIENSGTAKAKILDLLKTADTNILDFEIEKNDDTDKDGLINDALKKSFVQKFKQVSKFKSIDLSTKHNVYSIDWKKSGIATTSIEFESAGTKKLFEIAGPIINALENGNVVFIDEIDARLHPSLVRYIVMLFNSISQNPNNAQLVCNTHDVLLLEEEIRRDQIYFTNRNEYGSTSLYSLSDFKGVRKDSKILKQYLLGAFGATPNLKDFLTFKKKAQV